MVLNETQANKSSKQELTDYTGFCYIPPALFRTYTPSPMRTLLSSLCLVVLLSVAQPAEAQLREDIRMNDAPTQLYAQDTGINIFDKLFSEEHFRMGHSYEMSFGSFGGQSSSLGMYTNSLMWQFNDKLAARADISVAHSPFGSGASFQDQNARVFLRNAEIAYRPAENVQLHFQVRQSPYGSYRGPYGYAPHHYGRYHGMSMGTSSGNLFWNDAPR